MLFGGETAHSYYEEGLTAAMKGDIPLAASRFKRALELDSGLHPARHQLGKCYLRMGRTHEAVEQLKAAVIQLPHLAPPRVDAGYALLLLGNVEAARQSFSEALQVKSDEPRAVMGLARCAAATRQWSTVLGLVQHALEQGYAHFDARFLMARAADACNMPEIAAENYEAAAKLMEQSVEANPDQPTGYYLRGCVLFSQENYTAALSDFEAALSKAQKDAHYAAYQEHFAFLDILEMQGKCLQALGREKEARQVGNNILALAPDSPVGKQLAAEKAADDESNGKGGQ